MKYRNAISLLLAVLMVMLSMPTTVSAAATSGTTGDLTWTIDENGVLTISGRGAMPDYTGENPPWFESFNSITAVVVSNGVTSIGDYAFSVDGRYTVITVNDSENAGIWTFTKRCKFTTVSIAGSVEDFGEYLFWGCKNITIEGITDSAVQTYANDNSITFNAHAYGDLDGSESVDSYDAVLALQYVSEIIDMDVSLCACADVDGSGSLEAYDCVLMLQYIAEIITAFPAAE